jgi:hypothetical protein
MYKMLSESTKEQISNKIIELVVRNAIKFHFGKDMESLQISRVVSELMALILFSIKAQILIQALN